MPCEQRLGGHEVADQRVGLGLAAREDEDVARLRVRDGGVRHGVVARRAERVRAGPATREPGTIWVSGRSMMPTRPAASCTVATPSRARVA